MNLSCTTRAIKYLMFAFNFLFVITGIILIAVGATIHRHYNDYETFLDGKYFSLPNLLIATGTLIFIISFLGCYGALKESWIILMAFSVLLGVIFIFEFSAGIAGYVLRDKTSDYLTNTLYDTMHYYNETVYSVMWDTIQREFKCCGVVGPGDWVTTFNNNSSLNLPISCCPEKSGTMGKFICNNYVTPTAAPTAAPTTAPTAAPTTAKALRKRRVARDVKTEVVLDVNSTTTEPSTKASETTTKPQETTTKPTEPSTKAPEPATNATEPTTTPSESTSVPYKTGCEAAFGEWVKDHAVNIGAVGFALAVIQIVGIIFACHLSRQLKNRYYST